MKKHFCQRFLSVFLAFLIILALITMTFVFAESQKVTFTAQTIAEGFKQDVILERDPGTITMPSVTGSDTALRTGWRSASGWRPGDCEVSGWLYNGKYYAVGEVVNDVPAGAEFTAVYGNNTVTFDELPTNFKFNRADRGSNDVAYGSKGVTISQLSSDNNCLQFQFPSGQTGMQAAMVYKSDNKERAVCYTKGAEYKITFKYKRTDALSASCDIYLAFGLYLYNWWPESQAIQSTKIVTAQSGMTDFETVTAVVTAPSTYTHSSQGYASKAMGFRVKAAEGVTVQIDDVQLECTLGKSYANFTYGDGNGVTGTDTSVEIDSAGYVTAPKNLSAVNLLWENGGKYYKPGEKIQVGENAETFNAYFAGASINYENIHTDAVSLAGGKETQGLYESLSRANNYWKVPQGLSNTMPDKDGYYGLALGHDRMGIVSSQGVGSSKALRFRTNKNGTVGVYRSAALFAHDPTSFSTDSTIAYSYAYYTPSTEYTLEFDYKTVSSVSATIAFGVNPGLENNQNNQSVTVNSNTFGAEDTYVELAPTNGEWEHASVTVTSPASYTGNGITSGRVGIAVKDNEASSSTAVRYNYFDNVEFYPTAMSTDNGTKVSFKYSTANGAATALGSAFKTYADGDGSIILPEDENAIGLLWKNGDNLYKPGTKLNVSDLGGNLTFTAYFTGASLDFEDIYTGDIPLTSNATGTNLYGELTRASNYWRVPEGLSNSTADAKGYYGLALGHDRMGIYSGVGKEGKGLRLRTNKNTTMEAYYIADFFAHDPSTLSATTDLTYSYVYFTPKTEYTMEFDYKTYSSVSATIAFGVSQAIGNDNCGKLSVNSSGFGAEGTYVTLPSTGGEWAHATVKVTSPASYTGSGVTSARVGIALKDNETNSDEKNARYNYFDNIEIYPTELGKQYISEDDAGMATFDYGSSELFDDLNKIKFKKKLTLPEKQAPLSGVRKGTNSSGTKWTTKHGKISNQTAWYCVSNNTYYDFGAVLTAEDVGKAPVFLAVYEDGLVNFDNISNDFTFVKSNDTSYGFADAKIVGTDNKYVNLTGGEKQNNTGVQVLLFTEKDKFLGYNTGKTYKLTFKYRRTDDTDANSKLFFNFGAIPWGWRAASGGVSKITIGETKKGMTDFETVTAYVTAPDGYMYSTGGNNPEYYYSRTMGLGATLSNGVSIDFDDILVEPIGRNSVALTFAVPENNTQTVVIGKTGDKINIPDVQIDRNNVIEGWYLDKSFKKAFTLTTFPQENMTVYAKLGDAKVRYYGFVNYPWNDSVDAKGKYARTKRHVIEKGLSSDGDEYALKIVNTDSEANEEQQSIALPISVKPNTKYLISYDFYYDTIGDKSSQCSQLWFNTSVTAKTWEGTKEHITTTDEYIPASLKEKKWYTGYLYGTTTEYTWSNRLVLMVRVPVGSIRYIDNIIITELSENENVVLWKLGSFQSPKPTVARTNSTIKVSNPKIEGNYSFLNWMLNNEDYKEKSFLVEEDTIFTAKTTINRFDEGFENTIYGKYGITTFGMDLDWEIYDSSKGDKSNVNSGRYSLHRIGKDIRNAAYCFHHNASVTEYSMAEGQIYTVTFWAKVEKPVHKLGSIDIASCSSLGNPWDFPSDRFNVVAIADISDGKWHKLTYTFLASAPYLSVIVPGNLSVYIDDLTVIYTPNAEGSDNCTFEEYIPAYLTADGEYIKPLASGDELGKFELVKRVEEVMAGNGGISIWLSVIIGAATVALLGGGVTTVLLIRRKKRI